MARLPDRPRCRTCPYWDVSDLRYEYLEDSEKREEIEKLPARQIANILMAKGECRRYPSNRVDDKELGDPNSPVYWPHTSDGDWCGEHPDMAAWIADRKNNHDGDYDS